MSTDVLEITLERSTTEVGVEPAVTVLEVVPAAPIGPPGPRGRDGAGVSSAGATAGQGVLFDDDLVLRPAVIPSAAYVDEGIATLSTYLEGLVDQEIADRSAADTAITALITAESANRIAAINMEAATRAAADLARLPLAGGNMTGKIVLDGDPLAALHPATKQWVEGQIAAAVAQLLGGAPQAALDTILEVGNQLLADENAVVALTNTVATKLAKAANLGDLADIAAARANLGLGTAATHAHTDYDQAGAAAAAQAASQPLAGTLTTLVNNGAPSATGLAILIGSAAAARAAMALGGAATLNVGAAAGTVAAGDDARITGALPKTGGTMTGALVLAGDPTADLHPVSRRLLELVRPVRYVAGNYYGSTFLANQGTNSHGATNTHRTIAFLVVKTTTFDRIGIEVTTGGVTTCELSIYADSTTTPGYPGALLVDAGAVDCSTSGWKELTINVTLSPGLYWLDSRQLNATAASFRSIAGQCPFLPALTTTNNVQNAYTGVSAGTPAQTDPYPTDLAPSTTAGDKILLRAA